MEKIAPVKIHTMIPIAACSYLDANVLPPLFPAFYDDDDDTLWQRTDTCYFISCAQRTDCDGYGDEEGKIVGGNPSSLRPQTHQHRTH
jgi:hypothetical protein